MNCQALERWLEQSWERRERPAASEAPEALTRHLERCQSCRELAEAHERLFEGLASEIPSPLPDFARRVLLRLAENESKAEPALVSTRRRQPSAFGAEPSWLRRHSMVWLSAAAAALLAAFTILWNARDDSPERVAAHLPVAEAGAESSSGTAGQSAAADSSEASWDPSTEMQSVAMFFLSPPDLKTMVALVNRRVLDLLGDPAERVRQLPGGLRQVALSVNVTIDLLRQALPGAPHDALQEAPLEDSPARDATPGEKPPALDPLDANAA